MVGVLSVYSPAKLALQNIRAERRLLMSRNIDPKSNKLSDYDKQYLQDRGILPGEVTAGGTQTLLKDLPNTGNANTVGWTTEQLEAELERRREAEEVESDANNEKYQEALAEQGLLGDEEPADDYVRGWTQEMRREELDRRGLSTEGKASALVKRLRESDTEKE